METMKIIGFLQIITIALCFISQLNASKHEKYLLAGHPFEKAVVTKNDPSLLRFKKAVYGQSNKLNGDRETSNSNVRQTNKDLDKKQNDPMERKYQYDDDLDNYVKENDELTIPIKLTPEISHDVVMFDVKTRNKIHKLGSQPRAKRQIDLTQGTLSKLHKNDGVYEMKDADVLKNSRIDDNNVTKTISRRRILLNKASISQHSKEAKARRRERDRIKKIYNEKIKEIMSFLVPNYMTTNYMYDEMKRIKKQGDLGDKLMALVEHLEKPEFALLKENVLKCFWKQANKYKMSKPKDIWKDRVPNELSINPYIDPEIRVHMD